MFQPYSKLGREGGTSLDAYASEFPEPTMPALDLLVAQRMHMTVLYMQLLYVKQAVVDSADLSLLLELSKLCNLTLHMNVSLKDTQSFEKLRLFT